jgi:hypothetical protein
MGVDFARRETCASVGLESVRSLTADAYSARNSATRATDMARFRGNPACEERNADDQRARKAKKAKVRKFVVNARRAKRTRPGHSGQPHRASLDLDRLRSIPRGLGSNPSIRGS